MEPSTLYPVALALLVLGWAAWLGRVLSRWPRGDHRSELTAEQADVYRQEAQRIESRHLKFALMNAPFALVLIWMVSTDRLSNFDAFNSWSSFSHSAWLLLALALLPFLAGITLGNRNWRCPCCGVALPKGLALPASCDSCRVVLGEGVARCSRCQRANDREEDPCSWC